MTKREFIKQLHFVCLAFKRDVDAVETLVASCEAAQSVEPARVLSGIAEQLQKLQKNWPRARDFVKWPTLSEWADSNSMSKAMSDLKALFADISPIGRARFEGIEIDPGVMVHATSKKIINALAGQQAQEFPSEKLFDGDDGVEFINEMRRAAGERLFAKAKMVIPIYPETIDSDVNWGTIQKLKQMVYGSGYQPTSPYEKIIKIFRRGEILRITKGLDSWKKIATDTEMSVSTAHAIYDKAYELVYQRSRKKRPYKTDHEVTVPQSSSEIPENPGPSLRAKLPKHGKIESEIPSTFKSIFQDLSNGILEKCSQCGNHSPEGEYSPDPERPHNEIFTCNDCLV